MKVLTINLITVSLIVLFWTVGEAGFEKDLALYLPFNEGKGDNAKDMSKNNNNSILHKVKWTKGKYGNAVEFSGEQGGWVEVPDSPSLDITDEITLMAWVYPTQFTGEYLRIVVKTYVGDVAPWMVYGFYEEGGSNGMIGFIISVGKQQKGLLAPHRIPLNQWTHIAATYDGKEQRLYYNGEVKATIATSGKMDTNDIPVSIGRNNVGNREHFVGIIDEVAIFKRALSESEIRGAMEKEITAVEPLNKIPTIWGFIKSRY